MKNSQLITDNAMNIPPSEQDEVLSGTHAGGERSIMRVPEGVPHCDCQDKKEIGTMYPVEVKNDGRCTLCGYYAILKPLGNKKYQHGTKAMYADGCRCEVCVAHRSATRKLQRKVG